MPRISRVPALLLVVALATFTGCTTKTWIKPKDIGVFAKPPSEFAGRAPVRTFTGPDRRMVRVKGEPDMRIYLVGGGERRFDGPLVVKELAEDRYAINEGTPQAYELSVDTVNAVALERTSVWKGFAWAGIGVGAFLGVVMIIAGLSGGVPVENTTTQ